ncbi:MAG: exo-alpha-sialidase [Fuerstiella sp.]|nr:exo-alpha-sialidase [Fuerstiella sp.]MCP4855699.1 exo-alpha-sialidase [Fuerstiella sp.]
MNIVSRLQSENRVAAQIVLHQIILAAAVVLTICGTTAHAAVVTEENTTQFPALTDAAASQLKKSESLGLMEIAPVHLPLESVGDCNHFGWPIATMTGGTIVVMHRRIPGHNAKGAGQPDPTISYGIVLRSTDGGRTWSQPYDLRDCMRPDDRNRGGIVPLSHRAKFQKDNKSTAGYKVHLHSIGTTRDGAVVAINNHGVFRSQDSGQTWQHFSTAFRDDKFPHEIVNLGPRILDHSAHGLLVFGNWFGEANSYHKLSNRFVALTSPDHGATWKVEEHDAGFPQYEPATLFHKGRFLFVTRDQTKARAHKQISWLPGESPLLIDTNLSDPRLVDTVDFSFNPVTGRFEIVRSERHRMELWVWSMDPADWNTGQWHRECRLLAIEGKFYSTADGFHPAGAVVDVQRGVQHIFIYAGHPNGPAGVFRITRTLQTPQLAAALAHADTAAGVREAPAEKPPVHQ